MKRLCTLLVCLAIVGGTSFLVGCGSSSNITNAIASNQSINLVVMFARAGARAELANQFKKRGVSDEDSAAILAELHILGDQLLAGKDIRAIVADPAVWGPARADALPKLSAIIQKVKVSGVPVYDKVSADGLAGALLDSFAAVISELPKPTPATSTTT